jgi:DNA-binding XRE family transcriptional regulator
LSWSVQAHPEFEKWLLSLEDPIQDELLASFDLLRAYGPTLGRPKVDTLNGSRYPNMKELRVQYKGDPWRILFAFDPKRSAILLVGGDKGGDKRWYKIMAKDIQEIIRKLPKKRQEAIKARAKELIKEEMTLREVRKAQQKTQHQIAKALGVKQAAVSRLEQRTDMYLSTLNSYLHSMGGELEITAKFPNREEVKLYQFGTLSPTTAKSGRSRASVHRVSHGR